MSDDELRKNIRAIAAAVGITAEEGAENLRHNAALIAAANDPMTIECSCATEDHSPSCLRRRAVEWVRAQEGT